MQKRFPTLDLQHGATLRWDSYVNIRHVYKIEWALLKPYANPNTPYIQTFRFDRESCDKMLAKTKVLTNYEPGPQFHIQPSGMTGRRAATSPYPPLHIPATPVRSQIQTASPRSQTYSDGSPLVPYTPRSFSDAGSVIGSDYSGLSPIMQSDFGVPPIEEEMNTRVPKKRPPDGTLRKLCRLIMLVLRCLVDVARVTRRKLIVLWGSGSEWIRGWKWRWHSD